MGNHSLPHVESLVVENTTALAEGRSEEGAQAVAHARGGAMDQITIDCERTVGLGTAQVKGLELLARLARGYVEKRQN